MAEWSALTADSLKTALSHFNGGGFDRIICAYDGRDVSAYGEAEKAAEAAEQKAFIEPFKQWAAANEDKGFDFVGIPANLFDPSILDQA